MLFAFLERIYKDEQPQLMSVTATWPDEILSVSALPLYFTLIASAFEASAPYCGSKGKIACTSFRSIDRPVERHLFNSTLV